MKRSRIAGLAAGGGLVVLALAIGCGEEPSKPAVARPGTGAARVVGAGAEAVRGESAKERFHRRNRLDWVGVAHNAALVDLGRRLGRGEVHGSMCGAIIETVARGSYLPPGVHLGSQALREVATRSLAANGRCGTPGAAVRPAAYAQASGALSPDAATLVADLYAAVAAAPTSGDLAGALLPILDRAGQLDPIEADIVTAGASVAQSSMEHWEATLTDAYVASETDGILASYGDCFSYYGSAADAMSGCMGMRQATLLEPMTNRREGQGARAFHLAAAYFECPRTNSHEVLHQDVVGAIGGAMLTAWTGGGVLAGAAGGAIAGSSAEMAWQLGSIAWCYGSAVVKGTPIQKS